MTRNTADREYAFAEGRREFPNDLNGAELVRDEILGTITRESRAVLTGKREFPHDSVGARLVMEEVLGSITEDERGLLAEKRRERSVLEAA